MLSTDTILILSRYLSLSDIYNIGGTCTVARRTIRNNGILWKSLVCQRCPSDLWTKTNIDIDDWVIVAMTTRDKYDASSDRKLIEEAQKRMEMQMAKEEQMAKEGGEREGEGGERNDHRMSLIGEQMTIDSAEIRIRDFTGGLYLELQRQHILWRLSLPMSSKEALRLYCEISTPGLGTDTGVESDRSYEKVILVGYLSADDDDSETIDGQARSYYQLKKSQNALTKSRKGLSLSDSQERERLEQERKRAEEKRSELKPLKKTMKIVFKRADGKSFYFWHGEKGFNSTAKYYTVDRINSVSNNPSDKYNVAFTSCIGYMAKDQTILSKDDLETIGRLTKADRHQELKSKPRAEGAGNEEGWRQDAMMRARMFGLFAGAGRSEPLSVYSYTELSGYLRFDKFFQSIV